MTDKMLNRGTAFSVFLISLVVYLMTLSRTVVFWDVGEFCAAAHLLQVPHPPGSPFFLLVARVVSMIPFHEDIAYRMHAISAVGGALGVMFLYLVSVKVIMRFRGKTESTIEKILVYGTSAIGAFSLAFGNTYWKNAIEAEVYGPSMLFVSFIIWLAMRWAERVDEPHNEKYLFLIAYLIGLSIGIHLLAVLTIFTVMLIVYFTKYEFSRKTFIRFGFITVIIFFAVYPGVVKWLPTMMKGEEKLLTYVPFLLIAAAAYGVYKTTQTNKKMLHIALVSFLLIIIGYSTYTMVIIRANVPDMPMNENNPSDLTRLVSYLNREQYGEAPIVKRRYSNEPMHAATWQNYSSDMDFFLRYQINHMYFRYLLWNYVGAEGDEQDVGVNWRDTFGIPFLIGILGLYYHFRKDGKMALTCLVTFLAMGVILALYQNQQDPQPRERDYFYVGSFFIFSLWIAVGLIAIADFMKSKFRDERLYKFGAWGFLAVFLLVIPINLVRVNWYSHDRSGNYVAWDYSYNILQSCERDAIIFTNGDNDTFPLWYLQDVEGIRRDIRIVNLSLVNTPWYISQLKTQRPHGAKKVPISFSEGRIEQLQPMQWEPKQVEIAVSREAFEKFSIRDAALVDRGKITFTVPNTIQFGNIKAIKVQDIIVWEIIRSNNWERPIYFAVTVSPDSKIGLDEYLWMDGLAWRLKPIKIPPGQVGLHADIMRANLMNEDVVPAKEPQYGYLFRGLDNPKIYFDDNVRRLTQNYRFSFIRLALHYQTVENKVDVAKNILARMEQVVPRSILSMDWRLMTDIMGIYQRLGDTKMFDEYSSEIERICLDLKNKGQTDFQSYYNPYRVLLDIYEWRRDYASALDILTQVESMFPNDPNIKSRKQQYQALLNNLSNRIDTTKQ